MKMKRWGDLASHRAGCPYTGVAVYGTEEELGKYYSGNCPGCNVKVRWEEQERTERIRLEGKPRKHIVSESGQSKFD